MTDGKIRTAVCPICGQTYHDRPALDRRDNQTAICPDCGTRQALESIDVASEEREEILRIIHAHVGDAVEISRGDTVVAELCPHCGNEIEMPWDVETLGYTASCPVCGGKLMLCGECRDRSNRCDWDSETATCFRDGAARCG